MDPNNQTTKNNIGLVVGVIVVILIAVGLFFSLTSENTDTTYDKNAGDYVPADQYVQTINVKHQYKNGAHTYVGEIDLPTPCHTLAYNAVKDASSTKSFSLVFSSTAGSAPCAQVITSKAFKLSFEGPSDATVLATLNGVELRLNIFEVKAGQDLDSFDIYIKG